MIQILLSLACTTPRATDSSVDSKPSGDSAVHESADSADSAVDTGPAPSDSADSGPACPDAYADLDGDGFGDPASPRPACDAPGVWLADHSDCDDTDAAVHPGAVETCDGRDNDCDPTTPEEGLATWSADDGSFSDVTSVLAAGTAEAPLAMALDDGTWSFCGGTWYVQVDAEQSTVALVGYEGAVLDGGGSGTVVTVRGGTVSVADLELRDGEGSYATSSGAGPGGGGLACGEGATVTIDATGISANHAEIGGGLLVEDCTLSATDLDLADNSATYGGGMYGFGGATTFTTSTVASNVAEISGGGLGLEGTYATVTLDLVDTAVTDNSATYGGGLVLYEAAVATCEGSATTDGGFRRNTATSDGGAVYLTGGDFDPTLAATSCDFGSFGDDNSPADVYTNAGAYRLADDVTLTCSNAGCR